MTRKPKLEQYHLFKSVPGRRRAFADFPQFFPHSIQSRILYVYSS